MTLKTKLSCICGYRTVGNTSIFQIPNLGIA